MKKMVQIKVDEKAFSADHEKQLLSTLSKVEEIFPGNPKVQGHIVGAEGKYEGRILIRTRIGHFVAKTRAHNLFSLITKLHIKIMGQIVNWREKKASKKRYQRRKRKLALVPFSE